MSASESVAVVIEGGPLQGIRSNVASSSVYWLRKVFGLTVKMKLPYIFDGGRDRLVRFYRSNATGIAGSILEFLRDLSRSTLSVEIFLI